MTHHKVGSRQEWQAARDELLAEEKELTRRNDEVARKRRELPWVPVEEEYSFEADEGTKSLAELFDGRSQLLVYQPIRFLYDWSFASGARVDWVSTAGSDFNRDLGFTSTEAELRPFLEGEIPPAVKQMAEASGTDVAGYATEAPGLSAYTLSDGVVYRTYVTTARGLESTMGYYSLLDRTPMGRHEDDSQLHWLRRHDEY